MADLFSIVSVIEGSVSLILQCGSVVKTLSDIVTKHQHAKLTLLAMKQEVDTIQLAWSRIKAWSQAYAETTGDHDVMGLDSSFFQRLDRSLECGSVVMSALEDYLSRYIQNMERPSFKQRSKIAWNEIALRDHQDRVRGQAAVMGFLLQAIDLPSPKGRDQFLKTQERQLRESDESALSIVPSKMSSRLSSSFAGSTHTGGSHISLEYPDLVYRKLSFEDELYTAAVYKRNYRNHRTHQLSSSKDWGRPTGNREETNDDDTMIPNRPKSQDPEIPSACQQVPFAQSASIDISPSRVFAISPNEVIDSLRKRLTDEISQAVHRHDINNLHNLLKEGAQINSLSPSSGYGPLHSAAQRDDEETVRLLIQAGAKLDVESRDGLRPMDIALANHAWNVIFLLRLAGAAVCGTKSPPLYVPARGPDNHRMIEFLLDNGADLEETDDDGNTALSEACRHGQYANAASLLRLGARFFTTRLIDSPLAMAICNNDHTLLTLLLKHGVNPNHRCEVTGITPAMLACSVENPDYSQICHLQLLQSYSADFSARDFLGNQIFHNRALAAGLFYNDRVEVLEKRMVGTMLSCGGNIDEANNNGETPLFIAARGLHLWLIKLFLEADAVTLSDKLMYRLQNSFDDYNKTFDGARLQQAVIMNLLIYWPREGNQFVQAISHSNGQVTPRNPRIMALSDGSKLTKL